MVNIAILGFGTVGSGVYEVVTKNNEVITRKAGMEINVKYVLDLREFPEHEVNKVLTHNIDDILNDNSVQVVVEVMGGVDVPYQFVKGALEKGKHVVTSNKALVAAKGPELLRIAKQKNVNFLFEASVGGGIPILRSMNRSLTADVILEVMGILNGTTNYILTEMTENDLAFDDVLKTAQELGYAEKDPTADVEGYDACRKIAILSSLAYGKTANFEEILTEGITKITKTDICYAKKCKSVIKLVGVSKNSPEGISAFVAPMLLPKNHPLSNVNGSFNAIFVKGNMVGDLMFYGRGAGSLPTASAVVSDVIAAARHKHLHVDVDWTAEKMEILSNDHMEVKALVRIAGGEAEQKKALALFKNGEIITIDEAKDEFAVITDIETEKTLSEKIEQLSKDMEVRNRIRMEASE